jgi:hypothetical protein
MNHLIILIFICLIGYLIGGHIGAFIGFTLYLVLLGAAFTWLIFNK